MVREQLMANGFPERSKNAINSRAYCLGLRSPLWKKPNSGCFPKGHAPVNKGKKMTREQYEKCRHTMFQKGNRPANTLYDFAVTLRQSKAKLGEFSWYIRIWEGKWILLNQFAWSELHGDIPPKHVITMNPGFEKLVKEHFPEKPEKPQPGDHWQNILEFVKKSKRHLGIITMSENVRRNWDREKVKAKQLALTDNIVAGRFVRGDPELRTRIKKEYPGLIAIKRQEMLNKRLIKNLKK